MINLAEVVNDPFANQPFTIHRTQGSFVAGGWAATARTDIPSSGVITVAGDKALQQVPEGDRAMGSIQVLTTIPIYTTRAERNGISDTITWHDQEYRVQAVGPWGDYGFQSAILVRLSGK